MIENEQNRQLLSCKWPQYHFSMVFMMFYIISCSLLVCQMNIYRDSTHIDVNWCQCDVKYDLKYVRIVNFCCVNDHNTTFQSGFILKLLVFWSFEWIFIGIAFEFNLYNIYPIMKNKIFRLKWKNNVQNYKFYDLQDKVHIKHKSKFWLDLQYLLPIPFFSLLDPTEFLLTPFLYTKSIFTSFWLYYIGVL